MSTTEFPYKQLLFWFEMVVGLSESGYMTTTRYRLRMAVGEGSWIHDHHSVPVPNDGRVFFRSSTTIRSRFRMVVAVFFRSSTTNRYRSRMVAVGWDLEHEIQTN